LTAFISHKFLTADTISHSSEKCTSGALKNAIREGEFIADDRVGVAGRRKKSVSER